MHCHHAPSRQERLTEQVYYQLHARSKACNAGEKWVAKREPSLRAALLPDTPCLDAQIQQALQRRPTRTWLSSDLMTGVLKNLPRMLGLSPIGLTADAVNGTALSPKGTLSAEQQAQLNATAQRSLGSAYVAREIFHANGSALEVMNLVWHYSPPTT